MDNSIRPVVQNTLPAGSPAKPLPQKSEPVQAGDSVVITGSIAADVRGIKESVVEKSEAGAMSHPAYNELGDISYQVDSCLNKVKSAENRLIRSNNDLQDASRDLGGAGYSIAIVERDDKNRDVSREGHTIDRQVNSAEGELGSGKREEQWAEGEVRDLQSSLDQIKSRLERVERSLAEPDEQIAARLVKKAVSLTGNSKGHADESRRQIEMTDREIDSSLGQLRFADNYIYRIKGDGIGKDVSSEGRQLSYLVDRSQWDIRDAEKGVRNSQMDLYNTRQILEDVKKAVRDARNQLPSS